MIPAVSAPESTATRYEDEIARAVGELDLATVERNFRDDGHFIFIPRLLPASLAERMEREVRGFSPREVHRTYVPRIRKAGTIGQGPIARSAPLLYALYRSPSLLSLARRLSGEDLGLKSDGDAHAAALYLYQRRGDHVGFHYDDCGCEGTASYTGTFGIINRTTSRVHFQLFKDDPGRPMKELHVSMEPGSFVFFCGSRAYHRVTPLGAGEERVTYSFAYVKQGKKLTGHKRFVENIKDAVLYFGPRALFQRNYD